MNKFDGMDGKRCKLEAKEEEEEEGKIQEGKVRKRGEEEGMCTAILLIKSTKIPPGKLFAHLPCHGISLKKAKISLAYYCQYDTNKRSSGKAFRAQNTSPGLLTTKQKL